MGPKNVSHGSITNEETAIAVADKIGKENFNNPRDQYIYSRHLLYPSVLAKIWEVSTHTINYQIDKDRKNGFDWATARQEHWRQVTETAQNIIETQALEDAENTAALYRSMIGVILAKCNNALKTSDTPETYTIARTLKACHELDEKLTGAKAARAIFESQMKELEWFANLIEQNVKDPALVRRLAFSIEARKSIKTTIELKSYEDLLSYVSKPHKQIDKMLNAAEVIDAKAKDREDTDE